MPKHNNIIPNAHFRKHWQGRVKTWFDQPKRKERRRKARQAKAKRNFPAPVAGLLRPEVRCPTQRYNIRVRAGRGFTLAELKEAGFDPLMARSIGISVDGRRKNRSEEAFQHNVQRLKTYKSKLTVFYPKNSRQVKLGKKEAGDPSKAEQLKGSLQTITPYGRTPKARTISDKERKTSVYHRLRSEHKVAKKVGKIADRVAKHEAKKKANADKKDKK